MTYQDIFERLWAGYIQQNPSTKRVFDLFTGEGESVFNDHIA
jgi:hypothetical protein